MPASLISPAEWHNELQARRRAVWQIAQRNECDAVLVYGATGHAEPFQYLTNFAPVLGDGYAVLTGEAALACVLNFTWQLVEARAASGVEAWQGAFDPVPAVIDLLHAARPRRIGLAGRHRLPVAVLERLQAALPETAFSDIGPEVALLRRSKSPLELTLLREAGRITDLAFAAIQPALCEGTPELELAALVTYEIQRQGGDLSFPPTVMSGNDHPVVIRLPTGRRLQAGDSVMIDIGASVQGYQADATRTYVLGRFNAQQTRAWTAVQAAYHAVLAEIRPGTPCKRLHEIAVAQFEGAGYAVLHRIGHGIGLATSFEWPALDTETAPLPAGLTICIEPGVYAHGAGSMKLEDDLVVTVDGYELLTHAPREPELG